MTAVSQFPARAQLEALFPWELGDDQPRQRYSLLTPFTFVSAQWGTITAPAGMTTDFASIPRFAWRYIDPEDPCILMPSIIHDHLYTVQGALADGRTLTRAECDGVLLDAMALCGARWDQRQAVRLTLSLFGASHFGSN